jgi:hypothetical protein
MHVVDFGGISYPVGNAILLMDPQTDGGPIGYVLRAHTCTGSVHPRPVERSSLRAIDTTPIRKGDGPGEALGGGESTDRPIR